MDVYEQIAERIARSRYAIALTGAGISVESGIPDFRSAGGLWSKYDPLEFAYIEAFRANPAKVWKMLVELDEILLQAKPNGAHLALAELEKRGILRAVITQNVDSLHQRAGSTVVVEFHGNNRILRCDRCSRRFPREVVSLQSLPPRCVPVEVLCAPIWFSLVRPFPLTPITRLWLAAEKCDFMLIVGTSASVAPASQSASAGQAQGCLSARNQSPEHRNSRIT